MLTPQDVLSFWFGEASPNQHFTKDNNFDQLIKERFTGLHQQAAQGECYYWRQSIHGRLAEIIILDQFSRNMFRDTPQAFNYDGMALILAQEAIATGEYKHLGTSELAFLLMPYMHSESKAIHEVALELFSMPGLEDTLAFEVKHKVIIDRFGRYPHRNNILGRTSTKEELLFLQEPDSSF
ncbi:DUF924 family protein [Vagococcus vulneris]|uniref:DUF924 domain-containing protein n=1 Tax=Vagococcus vulneris TaxID=1977869 RepID=A0A429ZXJ4_9ENTE|nr:DUF924 family protein [Vagococcus vulneris]RST98609.1 hypothetical protein CBF37_07480 [Vagococcus vulneris]